MEQIHGLSLLHRRQVPAVSYSRALALMARTGYNSDSGHLTA